MDTFLSVLSNTGKQDSDQLTVATNRLITKICALEEEGSKTALHITDLEKGMFAS